MHVYTKSSVCEGPLVYVIIFLHLYVVSKVPTMAPSSLANIIGLKTCFCVSAVVVTMTSFFFSEDPFFILHVNYKIDIYEDRYI